MGVERFFKGVLGLLLLIAAVYLLVYWWTPVLNLIKGAVPFVVGLIGLIFIMLSFEK
jgi:hypothetical protein